MMRYSISSTLSWCVAILLLTMGCQNKEGDSAPEETPQTLSEEKALAIVEKAIDVHGQGHYDQLKVSFDFRDYHYIAERHEGNYTYQRVFTDSIGQQTRDVLTNEGFYREVDGERIAVPEDKANAYSNSVNSVIYFTLLPAFLADPAVKYAYLGEVTIKGKPYHKVKITFAQTGGGDDYQDEYVYWFHHDEHTLDYLAYNFQENGGGARFREVFDRQRLGGVLFQNYINYKPTNEAMEVATFDQLFETGQMEELSRIVNENLKAETVD